jgi:hypothetical protein
MGRGSTSLTFSPNFWAEKLRSPGAERARGERIDMRAAAAGAGEGIVGEAAASGEDWRELQSITRRWRENLRDLLPVLRAEVQEFLFG